MDLIEQIPECKEHQVKNQTNSNFEEFVPIEGFLPETTGGKM